MKGHRDLTREEAVARLQARHADDIAAYDEIHDQILAIRHPKQRHHRPLPDQVRVLIPGGLEAFRSRAAGRGSG